MRDSQALAHASARPYRTELRWLATLAARKLALWTELRQQRRQLRTLSDHMLRDLGLSRADVEGEASRPFWEVPPDLR